jgi:hypothetical protein
MNAASVLAAWGKRYGIPALSFDSGGVCGVTLDRGVALTLDLRGDAGELWLRLPLEVPESSPDALALLHRKLLEANFLGEQTLGGAFALDGARGALELCMRMRVSDAMEVDSLAACVEKLYGAGRRHCDALGLRFADG